MEEEATLLMRQPSTWWGLETKNWLSFTLSTRWSLSARVAALIKSITELLEVELLTPYLWQTDFTRLRKQKGFKTILLWQKSSRPGPLLVQHLPVIQPLLQCGEVLLSDKVINQIFSFTLWVFWDHAYVHGKIVHCEIFTFITFSCNQVNLGMIHKSVHY